MSDVALPGSIEPARRGGPDLEKGFHPLTGIIYLGVIGAALLFVAYSIYADVGATGAGKTSYAAFLLLFANAFSAYATAAALFSQRAILVPLMIQGAMRNEMDPNQQGFAQVLAFAMVVVVAIVMLLSHIIEKRAGRWQ